MQSYFPRRNGPHGYYNLDQPFIHRGQAYGVGATTQTQTTQDTHIQDSTTTTTTHHPALDLHPTFNQPLRRHHHRHRRPLLSSLSPDTDPTEVVIDRPDLHVTVRTGPVRRHRSHSRRADSYTLEHLSETVSDVLARYSARGFRLDAEYLVAEVLRSLMRGSYASSFGPEHYWSGEERGVFRDAWGGDWSQEDMVFNRWSGGGMRQMVEEMRQEEDRDMGYGERRRGRFL